jgi:cytoskeletal protein CcmA (bactofilin family)
MIKPDAQCGAGYGRQEGTVVRLRLLMRTSGVLVGFVGVALLLLSAVALAQQQHIELGGKIRSGEQIVVPAGETVPHDLYAAGGTVRIEGRVEGDVVAAAGEVDVSGTVTGDVLTAGGTTMILGQVDGDVRTAAGQVTVRGSVGEDLLMAGGRTTIASQARVGEDLIFTTGQTIMDGTVAGDVLGSTGTYIKRGVVAGTERVIVGEPAVQPPPTIGERVLDRLRRYVSILAVGALLLWLVPRALRGIADVVRGRPLPSLGAGVLGIIGFGVIVLAVILVTVLVAIVLGLLGFGLLTGTAVFGGILTEGILAFLFFIVLAFGAQAAVGLSLGRLLLRQNTRSFLPNLGALALGVLVVVVISSIPLVGGVLEFVLILLGLGALILALWPRLRGQRAQPAS